MRSMDSWISEYRTSHRDPFNQLIHKICVPIITFATLGLVWSIPTPASFEGVSWLNWGTLLAVACLTYYFFLSFSDALVMAVVCAIDLGIAAFLDGRGLLLTVSVPLFALAWVVQIYGHRVEGRNPSFLKNAVFLLIGPVWVNRSLILKWRES